ncbi:hypothetical protein B0H14DRAFT_2611365 [Mycena olivaceomarginata]|nr:hypothetical protein B0H14DRAFT_2611365 [Mycena olivaceomarginata]
MSEEPCFTFDPTRIMLEAEFLENILCAGWSTYDISCQWTAHKKDCPLARPPCGNGDGESVERHWGGLVAADSSADSSSSQNRFTSRGIKQRLRMIGVLEEKKNVDRRQRVRMGPWRPNTQGDVAVCGPKSTLFTSGFANDPTRCSPDWCARKQIERMSWNQNNQNNGPRPPYV